MYEFLDWINPDEFLTLVALIVLLVFIGGQMTRTDTVAYYNARRLSGATVVLYSVLGICAWEPSTASEFVVIVLRALFAAGVIFGASLILLAVLHHLIGNPVTAIIERFHAWTAECRRRAAELQADWNRQRQETEWERDLPRREQAAREAAARAVAAAEVQATAQQRREAARAQCELAYNVAAPEIGARFSKEDFADFVAKYLGDKFPPELVEERGRQLQAIIRQHQVQIEPSRQFQNLRELAIWLEERRAEIEAVPDEKQRQTLLARLNETYSEFAKRVLSEMFP